MKKVCIIDSGYSNDSNIRIDQIERSLTIRYYNNTFHVDDGAEDKIGHGTAILSILQHGSSPDIKYNMNETIYPGKIIKVKQLVVQWVAKHVIKSL